MLTCADFFFFFFSLFFFFSSSELWVHFDFVPCFSLVLIHSTCTCNWTFNVEKVTTPLLNLVPGSSSAVEQRRTRDRKVAGSIPGQERRDNVLFQSSLSVMTQMKDFLNKYL